MLLLLIRIGRFITLGSRQYKHISQWDFWS